MSSQLASHMAQNPPTYDQAVYAADVAQQVETERESGVIDKKYVKGIPGLIKALEVVCIIITTNLSLWIMTDIIFQGFSLIAFICVTVGAVVCVPYVATTGFFNFIAMAALVTTLFLYVILLLKLQQRIFRCDFCKWPMLVC